MTDIAVPKSISVPTSPTYAYLRDLGRAFGVEIYRPGTSQLHFFVTSAAHLIRLCTRLRDEGCYLVTMLANDERALEENCFKLFYVFSHVTEHVLFTIEFPLPPNKETYPSIDPLYPAVEPFAREIADLFGLRPEQSEPRIVSHSYLHAVYPEAQHPLRRDWRQAAFQRRVDAPPSWEGAAQPWANQRTVPEGEVIVPVGPVHAGVIEPGVFSFNTSGEVIEGLEVTLGFAHKGIERLFQDHFTLETGWRLAERVAGDTAFSHSAAYCKAVESLMPVPVPAEAHELRALFLELERIDNHVHTCTGLALDLGLDLIASEMAALREDLLRLHGTLSGSRFLKGVNRPGGVCLPAPLNTRLIRERLPIIVDRFIRFAQMLIEHPDFRDRTIGVGVLTRETAQSLGITGLAARASGLNRDFRLQHPFGPYLDPAVQAILRGEPAHDPPVSVLPESSGDVFRRFVQRVLEVHTSGQLVNVLLQRWNETRQTDFLAPFDLTGVVNYEWGIGYLESARGDIVYWVMKDKFARIYRCKVRDASTLNWAGLLAAVGGERGAGESALADFPLINKSFNLSYAGNDL